MSLDVTPRKASEGGSRSSADRFAKPMKKVRHSKPKHRRSPSKRDLEESISDGERVPKMQAHQSQTTVD